MIEHVERRVLLASLANVQVNEPNVDTTTNDTQSETASLAFGSTVLVAYNDSASNSVNGQQFTGWSRSTDGGATFSDLGRLPFDGNAGDGITGDAGDPMWARDRVSGRVYLSTLSWAGSGLQLFRSDDNGMSLQPPVNALPGLAQTSGDFVDKPWIAVDNAAGAGQGNVYAAANIESGGGAGSKPGGIYFSRSGDGGATWSLGNTGTALALGQVEGANVVVGLDHAVYVFWLDFNAYPETIQMRKSTDGGTTFGPAVIVANHNSLFVAGALGLDFRSNSFPQAAVNPVSGNLYLVYNDKASSTDRGDIKFTLSIDGGATWSSPLRVNDDATNNDQFYPTLAVTPDGAHLFVGWDDRRNDPDNKLIDTFGATATIAGSAINWSPNFRISSAAFPVVVGVDPALVTNYMSDYESASATSNGFFYSWSDNRDYSLFRPSFQANVRLARIPITGAAGAMVINSRPALSIAPISSVQVDFNRPMNASSFSLADVDSFTGPGGTNLLPQLTGFSWIDADTLQINFAAQSIDGAYRMEIGPNIAAASGGPATMDQDVDGVAGESVDDRAAITFTNAIRVGPDGFGYSATATSFEAINLDTGSGGATSILDGSEDVTASIPLGTNTFNFYGTTYTGSNALWVTDNGFLSFGSGATDFTNGDLKTQPAPPTIAPLWDDWSVKINSPAPATNSRVLYKFDTANNRLIVEWSDVPHWENNTILGPATFQAILQLNTGSTPGAITFNYVDLTVGDVRFENAISATVGVKGAGTQGPQWLVIHKDAPSLYVGEGKAIRITAGAPDTKPPTVSLSPGFVNLVRHSDAFVFSEDVLGTLTAADITVQNLTTGTILPTSALQLSYNALSRRITLTFPGVTGGVAPGILPDGNYRLTISSSGVTDQAGNPLDGDANGTAGGDFVQNFVMLSGDADHDGRVDLTDFTILAANFNQTSRHFGEGNFNYDSAGNVDLTDFTILAAHFNQTLAAAAAMPVAAGPTISSPLSSSPLSPPLGTGRGLAWWNDPLNTQASWSDTAIVDDVFN